MLIRQISLWALTLVSIVALAASVTIGGQALTCDQATGGIGRATPEQFAFADPDNRRISLNLKAMAQQAPMKQVQWFVFYHECGHLNDRHLHTHGPGQRAELVADSYAVARALREGWFTAEVAKAVCDSFPRVESETHPSRAQRCANVQQTYQRVLASTKRPVPSPPQPRPETRPTTVAKRIEPTRERLHTTPSGAILNLDDDMIGATR